MNYLNLETNEMRAPAFACATAAERGVWLSLMLHCVSVENGGEIEAVGSWTARQWLLVFGLDLAEVQKHSALWHWHGMNLEVWGFPHDKLDQVKAGRVGGKKGGRPKKQNPPENPPENPPHNPKGMERNGKGMEEEGKGSGTDTLPPPDSPSISSNGSEPEKKEGGAGVPVTVEAALAYAASYSKGNAEMLVIEDASVRNWFDDRCSCGWQPVRSGVQVPIPDWRADLRKWAREDQRRNGFQRQASPAKKEQAVPVEEEPSGWWDAWALCWPDVPVPPNWHGIAESFKTELRIKLEDMNR
jgi:hypothetical protein